MDQKWEIRKVSTPERIFNKIKEEMAQPVGIVLFGADGDFKKEVLETVANALRDFACFYRKGVPDTGSLVEGLHSGHSAIVIVMNSEESSMHDLRHELVKVMRNAGAKSVVGIYVKVPQKSIRRPLVSNFKDTEFSRRITAIERSNPNADGLDCFVVVEEEG